MTTTDPVAIVGVGCRFPRADGPDALWRLLTDGVCTAEPFERDHVGAQLYDPQRKRGHSYIEAASLLSDPERFDSSFFGMTVAEARALSPVTRQLMQTSWHALEDAGIVPADLRGTRTGVFVGSYGSDWTTLQAWGSDLTSIDPYVGPGSLHSMASGRIAHHLDLNGPALTVDTACSSSLVAFHLAVESLNTGQCELALAGGSNLALSADAWISLSLTGMASADGRSKAFDGRADGYGRGEGSGVVVLERLSHALAAGRQVLAVVRGSAVKHDGRGSSMMAPSAAAQAETIAEALAAGSVSAGEVTAVEAHGTGTPTGDPIEMEALAQALGAGAEPLLVGSIKANIGHTEATAGIAGIIKATLALEHGVFPGHLHLQQLNPRIDLSGTRIMVSPTAVAWDGPGRLIGVNSFGLSGTNAHAVLQAPDAWVQPTGSAGPPRPDPAGTASRQVLRLSAGTAGALVELSRRYADLLDDDPDALGDVARTLSTARQPMSVRASVSAETATEAVEALRRVATGVRRPVDLTRSRRDRSVTFLYSGQGSQRFGVGADLYAHEPVFAAAVDQCRRLMPDLGADLLDVWFADPAKASLLDRTSFTQPVLFVLQYALTQLWAAAGVRPTAVTGHSVGAIAAGVAANALSLPDACRFVVARGQAMEASEPGAMLAVQADPHVVADVLGAIDGLSLAADNGAGLVTLSGPVDAVEQAADRLGSTARLLTRLSVRRAFHSSLMDPVLPAIAAAAPREVAPPTCAWVGDMSGTYLTSDDVADPSYWSDHARRTVQFGAALTTLAEAGGGTFVEIGPGRSLHGLTRRTLPDAVVVSSLPGTGDRADFYAALEELLDRTDAVEPGAGRPVDRRGRSRLPGYPFGGEVLSTAAARTARDFFALGHRGVAAVGSDASWAGQVVPLSGGGLVAQRRLSAQQPDIVEGHRLFGAPVVPGAFWLCGIAAAARQELGAAQLRLERVEFSDALVLREGVDAAVVTQLLPAGPGSMEWQAEVRSSAQDGIWRTHAVAHCTLGVPGGVTPGTVADPRRGEIVSGERLYREAAPLGLQLNRAFTWITAVEVVGPGQGSASVQRPTARPSDRSSDQPAGLHPGLLDACFQAVAAALPQGAVTALTAAGRLLVPGAIDQVWLDAAGCDAGTISIQLSELSGVSTSGCRADLVLRDVDGAVRAELLGTTLVPVSAAALGLAERAEPAPIWTLEPVPSVAGAIRPGGRGGVTVVAGVDDPLGAALAASLGAPLITPSDHVASDPTGRRVVCVLPSGPPGSIIDAATWLLPLLQRPVGELWVVTRGVWQDSAVPGHAAAGALTRSFAAEHEQRFGGLLDLSATEPDLELLVEAVVQRMSDGPLPDGQASFDGRSWSTPRLRRVSLDARSTGNGSAAADRGRQRWRADACYVVTGGLGGLGRAVVRWLVEQGAGRVVLFGRRPAAAVAAELADLAGHSDARIRYLCVDLVDPVAVAEGLAAVQAELGPVAGVYHAAGLLDDGPVEELSDHRLQSVAGPKVTGLAALVSALPTSIEHVVAFSSLAGVLGGPLQGNYAAANAAMDAVAANAREAGLPVLSVAWGPWQGEGMLASREAAAAAMAATGIRAMEPAAALLALRQVVDRGLGFSVVADLDATRLAALAPSRIVAGLLDEVADATSATAGSGLSALELAALPHQRRRAVIEELVVTQLAGYLDVAPSQVPTTVPVTQLGIDSLMGVELRNAVQTRTGVSVPVSMLLGGTTAAELAAFTADRLSGAAGPGHSDDAIDGTGRTYPDSSVPAAVDTAPADLTAWSAQRLLERLDDLDDAQVEELLAGSDLLERAGDEP